MNTSDYHAHKSSGFFLTAACRTVISALAVIYASNVCTQLDAFTWSGNGSDGSVDTAANWVENAAPPNSYSDYIFTGTKNTIVTLPGATKNLSTLTFDGNAGAFVIRGEEDVMSSYRFGIGRSTLPAPNNRITQNSSYDQAVLATMYISNAATAQMTITGTGLGALTLGSIRMGAQASSNGIFYIERDVAINTFTLLASGTVSFDVTAGKTVTVNVLAGTDLATAGNFGVHKLGEGTLALTGTNRSTGPTVIAKGRLLLDRDAVYGNGALTPSFTVKSTAGVEGNGRISASLVAFEDNSTLRVSSTSGSAALQITADTYSYGNGLRIGGAGSLNAGTGQTLNASSLDIAGGMLALQNAVTLANGGTIWGSGTLSSTDGITFGSSAGDTVQAAITSGRTLLIGAAVTGPANINITSGNLLVANAISTGNITVASGAGFGGAGTIGGEVSAGNGATITAGAAVAAIEETLTLQGGLRLGSVASDVVTANIAANKTLHVGTSLAGPGKLEKTGAGVLRLSGNQSAYAHAFAVGAGTLLIDNGLGSPFVNVTSGATFGGAGIVSGSVSLGAGSSLVVGAADASVDSATSRTLTINGAFSFGASGTLYFDILKKGALGTGVSTSLAIGGAQNYGGTASGYTIDLMNILTGVYNLGNVGYLADSGSAAVTVGGNELSGRQSAWIEKDGTGNLILHTDAGSSMKLRWSGASGTWNTQTADWLATSGSIAFGSGDMVFFDSVSDAGHEQNRNITLTGASMLTSGMEVSGTGNYSFHGAGIVTDKEMASEELASEASGKLVKKGSGVLTLANTGVNNFKEGIELEGGVLEIANAGALGANNLTVTGADTLLRFNAAGVSTSGTFDLSHHALNVEVAQDSVIGGVVTGANALIKTGAARLTLDASLAGAVNIDEGTLKIGMSASLADNPVRISSNGTLDVSAQNNTLRNVTGSGNIEIGNAILTLDNATEVLFAGSFSGSGSIVKTGSADLVLSGSSRHEGGTQISAGRLVINNADALGTGITTVDAAPGVALVFQGAIGSRATPIVGDGAVDVFDSFITLGGNNVISKLRLSGSSVLTAASAGALGGANAAVEVGNGSMLRVANRETNATAIQAGNIMVNQGGALLFAGGTAPGKLSISGTLLFAPGGTVGFDGPVASGIYTLATSNGIPNAPQYQGSQYGMDVTFATNDNTLSVLAINQAANPSKDAALAFDAMIATMTAVYNRISEGFLLPVVERQAGSVLNDLWIKGIASRATYESKSWQAGHTDETYGVVLGYDGLVNERYLFGLYGGLTESEIRMDLGGTSGAQFGFGGIYGAFKHGSFYAGADISGGIADADTRRAEGDGEAVGSYKAEFWGASGEIGFIINAWKNGVVKPSLAIHGMRLKIKDYKEEGPGALRVGTFSEEVVQSLLSIQAAQKTRMLNRPAMFDVMFGWRQTVHDSNPEVTASFAANPEYSTVLANPGYVRGSFVAGVGARISMSRHTIIGLGYDYETASGRSRHTLLLTARWMW